MGEFILSLMGYWFIWFVACVLYYRLCALHLGANAERFSSRSESLSRSFITKTRLFKYILNFLPIKNENFQIKNSDIFLISAQNLDCGYSLEPPRRGGSNEYPQFRF